MKNKIILGILFVCILGISASCSSDETDSMTLEVPEMKPENQVGSEGVIYESKRVGHEIDGQWTSVVDGIDGKELKLNYRFRAEGENLIGLIESRLGGGPISEGKIDGKNVEFTLHAGEDIVIKSNGVVDGDEIHITQTIGEEEIKIVLKRVKYD